MTRDMNKRHFTRALAQAAILMMLAVTTSCETSLGGGMGELRLHFAGSQYAGCKAEQPDLPDTAAFLLCVQDEAGRIIYEGRFGDSPEKMLVEAGTYAVSIRSEAFEKPLFSAPQYGDDQVVVVPAGEVVEVRLSCRQVNAGIRLNIEPSFLKACPDGVLYVASRDGKLLYAYRERRIAYFKPGEVSVILAQGGTERTVFSRNLEPQEILTVRVGAQVPAEQESGGRLHVAVDTTRNWTNAALTLGGESGGGDSFQTAWDVATALRHTGATGVWVYGYIAGAFKSQGNIVFEAPFPSATNLALAGRASATTLESCLSAELKKGALRDELNLFDHPGYKGRKVWLQGDIVEAYYGIPGIKNITDWVLE